MKQQSLISHELNKNNDIKPIKYEHLDYLAGKAMFW